MIEDRIAAVLGDGEPGNNERRIACRPGVVAVEQSCGIVENVAEPRFAK